MPAITERAARAVIDQPLPEMGPNKIQQALEDYDHMANDLASARKSLAEYVDIATALKAENEALRNECKAKTDFLTQQLDAVSNHRDRLNTALQGYIVRYRMVRKTIEDAEHEALEAGLMQEPAPPRPIKAVSVGAIGPTIDVLPQNKLSQ